MPGYFAVGGYNEFPLFAAYLAFQLLGFLITFAMSWLVPPHATLSLVTYRWSAVGVTSIADIFELAVFYELSDHLIFRRSHGTSKLRPVARWTVALLILVAAASSALLAQTGRERVVLALQVVECSASVVSVGFIVVLLIFARALRISWTGLPAGIGLGFSVSTCPELSAAALISALGKIGWVGVDFIGMGHFTFLF